MKVLIHAPDFPPSPGGIAVFVQAIAEQLVSRGHAVEVLSEQRPGAEEVDTTFPFTVTRYLYKRPASFRPGIVLIRRAVRWKPDVILLGMFMSTHALGAVVTRLGLHTPYAILIHLNDARISFTHSAFDRRVSQTVMANASLLLANSEYTRREMVRFGACEDKTRVLYPGVDADCFRPLPPDPELKARLGLGHGPVLLTCARLVAKKNHSTVLKALKRVAAEFPEIQYIIAGEGPERENLECEARELGVSDRVIFAGNVPHAQMPAYYSVCDVYVMPSRESSGGGYADVESFGIAYAEASACGKPVIAGNSGGGPEAIVGGETGILVDPEDAGAIADNLLQLLHDREYAARLGANGRGRVEAELTWRATGERVEAALAEIAIKK